MKTASPALIALLDSQTFLMADLLTITMQNDTVLRYCTWDTDLTVDGNIYSAHGLLFQRDRVRNVIGVEVDSMTLTLYPKDTDLIGDMTVLSQLRTGGLDAARVKIDKVIMATPGDTSAGTISMFSGRVSSSSFGRTEASIDVVSDLILLNVQLPRNVYQPPCLHTLYDDDMLAQGKIATGCRVSKAAFEVTAVIAHTSTTTKLETLLGATFDTGYFDLGYLVFMSGANSGYKRSIKSYANTGQLTLGSPLLYPPLIGDTFIAFPGCDHQQSTCVDKFNNLANFRGFPYVPSPETAV